MGFSTSAEAAEVENESISISENILVDNNELEIKAIVKYDRDMKSEEEPTDAGEISFRKPSDDHIVSDEATGDYFVDNEILLTAREGTAREEIEKIVSEINGVIVGCIEITNDYQIEISEAKTVSELNEIVEQLKANNAVDDITIHYVDEIEFDAIPNDSKWASEEWSSDYPEGTNWGVEAINAMEAWEHYDEMSYVKVGIIDTMFDTNQEDLVYTKVWNNPESIYSEKDEKDYIAAKSRFFNLSFADGNIMVRVLESLSDFYKEGKLLHHCVFSNAYYKREDSLIMSATVDGRRMETVEFSLSRMEVCQCRGKSNQLSAYHDRILNLVRDNIPLIRERMVV